MKKLAVVALILLGLLSPTLAGASPLTLSAIGGTLTASTNVGASLLYTNIGGTPVGTLEATFVDKNQTSLIMVVTGVYTNEFDFNFGFRWTERVTNNTGVAWSAYSILLAPASADFFQDGPFPTPTFVNTDGTTFATAINVPGRTIALSPVGPNSNLINLTFATPIAPGESFSAHIPLWALSSNGGTFTVTETATAAVPEPASFLLLGGGLAVGLALRARGRSRRAKV